MGLFPVFFLRVISGLAQDYVSEEPPPYCLHQAASGNGGPTEVRVSALSGLAVGGALKEVSGNGSGILALRPFTSDGCSMSPDGVPRTPESQAWTRCCVKHDVKYWLGGPESEKKLADQELSNCLGQSGYPYFGWTFWFFVDAFGGPGSSKKYRWGYGWTQRRPYRALSTQEEKSVEELYGLRRSEVSDRLYRSTKALIQTCDQVDPAIGGFTPAEKAIYEFLSLRLAKAEIIDWATTPEWSSISGEVILKLKSCSKPVRFFFENSKSLSRVDSSCDLINLSRILQ